MERVSFKWTRIGGNTLTVKEIASFAMRVAVSLYHVRNNPNHSVFIPELKQMLEEERDRAMQDTDDFFNTADPPEFTLSMQVPKITGQNTQQFQGWNWRQQNWRKTLHVVVEAGQVQYITCTSCSH